MNANETTPKANARLNQIKAVSRAAKFLVIGFLIFTGCFLFMDVAGGVSTLFRNPRTITHEGQQVDFALLLCRSLAAFGFQIVLCVWYWKLSRLFRFYEHGLIFAAETIRCIKVLGLLFFTGGMFNTVLHSLPKPPPPVLPPGVIINATHVFQMGFFRFDFGTGIDFGLLLAGAVIILIAWIMDEGRKIQEEQELTV
jgi:hypothetical protein